MLLAFYLASVSALTGVALGRNRLPKRLKIIDLALIGIATHKLSRTIGKDRITSILRAPFVNYIRRAGAGEVEEEPRGRGLQRGEELLTGTVEIDANANAAGQLDLHRIE